MMRTTITPEYLLLQKKLHETPSYGVASLTLAPIIASLIKKTGCKSVSDYGAGKRRLAEGLRQAGLLSFDYHPYDPAFPEYGEPKIADLVCCVDVLEHIEPELIDEVINDLKSVTQKLGFFSIHMGPAGKTLSDGRNAHLIQQPSSWWLAKLVSYFEILHLQSHTIMGSGFWVVVAPKKHS